MSNENKNEVINENDENTFDRESMIEAIDNSFTKISRGDILKGIVIYATDNEVIVNIKYRSDGIIEKSELDNQNNNPNEIYKSGDEIDVFVLRLDDGQGNVVLSTKRLKDMKVLTEIEDAFNNKLNLEINVKNTTKGGLIVEYKNVQGFMPASQSSYRFLSDLSELVGKNLLASVIDFDKTRKKIIFSRKEIEKNEMENKKINLWNELVEGQSRKGIVQRISDFGAFVDLGGVDGLIHISDISWNRIKHPSDVLKEGEEVEVIILSANKETNRISLGLKQTTVEPWQLFITNNKIGDIVKGKVVNVQDFGAFVRLKEDVDGLLHVSQISKDHIEKPSDVLSIDQEIEVKIIDIKDDKKVSLSIKAIDDETDEISEIEENDTEISNTISENLN